MSAINLNAPVVRKQAFEEPKHPTVIETLQAVVPLFFFVPVAGPPAILLVGPLLLLVLLLVPPAACLITLTIVLALGAGLLAALGALLASPYLLVRHLRARHARAGSEAGVSQAAGASHAAPVWQPAAVAERVLKPTTSPVGA
jgi:hypothetical protein